MRVFIALLLPQEARAALAAHQRTLATALGAGVRWTPIEQLHVTLRFVGDCRAEQAEGLRALVRRVASETPPVEIACQPATGAFPHARAPRILWAGLAGGAAPVTALAERMEREVVALELQPAAHAFHPHITLGRVDPARTREISRRLETCQARLADLACRVETLALVESRLAPQGAIHTVLEAARLQGR